VSIEIHVQVKKSSMMTVLAWNKTLGITALNDAFGI
jgi:hypothetical protein